MLDRDYAEFSGMLDGVASLLTRGTYTPNPSNTALYFRALQRHDIRLVRSAFDAHVRDTARGRFMPTPADILAQIETIADDGRPGAEEAWSMVPMGEDETVVWTSEMAEAYGACSALIVAGDRIAARMTFKEVYERLVLDAKRTGRPAVWQASLGHDHEKRKRALTAAVDAGRITAERAHSDCPALPVPESQQVLLPPAVPQARERFNERLNALVEAQTVATPKDPLAWAKRLRDRERAGEELSQPQKDMWRNALDAAPDVCLGAFSPIPDHLLPPAMRRRSGAHA